MKGRRKQHVGTGVRLSLGMSAAAVLVLACSGTVSGDVRAGPTEVSNAAVDPHFAAMCASLVGKNFGDARVTGAQMVRQGDPLQANLESPVTMCRVQAAAAPVPDSHIRIEFWLPAGWNGKMLGQGGGGLNGGLDVAKPDLAQAVGLGYAGVATDSGHKASATAKWAIGHPAAIVDFGDRGDHVAAVAGKAIVAAFYGKPASRNYFRGCSDGGREALMTAQRHPTDYDGIIAGAPAYNFTGLMSSAVWNARRVDRNPAAATLPTKLKLLRAAAIRQCDKLDEVADNVIENPLACKFDPAEIECTPGEDAASCLTTAEVEIARKIYRGPRANDGSTIVQGPSVGSEEGWGPFITEGGIGEMLLGDPFFRGIVYQNADWSPRSFELNRDFRVARQRVGPIIDAANPDLSAFMRHGGKLLVYQGWEDPAVPAESTLHYYKAMRRATGAAAARNTRLFMMPGVGHCEGGHGPSDFDKLDVLDRWVSTGVAPDRIVAKMVEGDTHAPTGDRGRLVRTRPLCAWPKVARYKGAGSTDDAENFSCVAPTAKHS